MAIATRPDAWIQEHDIPGTTRVTRTQLHGPQSLGELIELCASRPAGVRFKASGSHWALSFAALSDGDFIETNDPSDMQRRKPLKEFPALGRTLYDVVPAALNPTAIQDLDRASKANPYNPPYYVHVESGKRIYQIYSELDLGDETNPKSLAFKMNAEFRNPNFSGSWAFETLGGAGGQTIVGALTTGTHGGDVHLPPVSDFVRAIHLVVDGGHHYWIEPERPSWLPTGLSGGPYNATFTSDQQLRNLYDQPKLIKRNEITQQLVARFPEAGKFEIIRNDDVFNAVLVSAGRFGVIYSVVLQVVRQYMLREVRSITDWQTVKRVLNDPTNPLFENRFVQIAICLSPHDNGTKNKCGISVRNLSSPPPMPDLRLISWNSPDLPVCPEDDDPPSVWNLVVVGTDNNGVLHIRIFDASGHCSTDTDEGKLIEALSEETDDPDKLQALVDNIATLKQKLPSLSSPHVMTETEKWQVFAEAISITGDTSLNTFGKVERIGKIIDKPNPDPRLNAPRFENAGTTAAYDPGSSATFIEKACSGAEYMETLVDGVIEEIETFAHDNIAPLGGALATAAAIGGMGLPALIPALLVIAALLRAFLELLKNSGHPRLGLLLDNLRQILLNQPTADLTHAGIFIWRAVVIKVFEQQQGFHDVTGFSYAVMDSHDYTDLSCRKSVDSIEVFFDGTSDKLITYIDQLLLFEANQNFEGKSAIGYISLRYMTKSRALLGLARHPLTCSVEVSALRDVTGSTEFVTRGALSALNKNIDCILHWGQRNPSKVADIEHRFNAEPGGDLYKWRAVLSRLTDNGRLDGFSSDFTREKGLEVVDPRIDGFSATVTGTAQKRTITANWNCFSNPPGTILTIKMTAPSGQTSFRRLSVFRGSDELMATERGNYRLTLIATITLVDSPSHETQRTLTINVT